MSLARLGSNLSMNDASSASTEAGSLLRLLAAECFDFVVRCAAGI
jgi:hypothetical protein